MRKKRKQSGGFTLIELLITIVIIGILASIAVPSYTRYVTNTRRTDCQRELLTMANLMEKFKAQCNHYATAFNPVPNGGNICANDPPNFTNGQLAAPQVSENGDCAFAILPPVDPNCVLASDCYLLQVTPLAAGRLAGNGASRLDHAGRKSWDKNGSGAVDQFGSFTSAKWTDKN